MARSAARSVGDGRSSVAELGTVGAWQRGSAGSPFSFRGRRSSYVAASCHLSSCRGFLCPLLMSRRWSRGWGRGSEGGRVGGGAAELSGIFPTLRLGQPPQHGADDRTMTPPSRGRRRARWCMTGDNDGLWAAQIWTPD
uniref:Uncharacterized protein n=1 Tax=Oryza punctata TaxID=4537 RepID=A0A0E0KGJ6_ORYPU